MAAVGLSDVFKYGGTFLGYLVAVAVASAVFVGGGAYFAMTGDLNVLNPSLAALTTGRAIAGAVLVVLGVVISLSGLIGLLHKLLADAAAAALESARSSAQAVGADQDAESEDETESPDETPEGASDAHQSADENEPAVAEDGAETPLDGEDTTGTVSEKLEPDRPAADASPPQEPAEADGELASRSPSAANSGAEAAPDHGETSPPEEPQQAPPDQPTGHQAGEPAESDDPVDESATDDEWGESRNTTGAEETSPQEATEIGEEEPLDDVEDDDTARAEWTPPDPAEFEQSTESTEEAVPEQTDPDPSDSTAQTTSEDVVRDVEADSHSDEDVRTWDDVQSASGGDGMESGEKTVDNTNSDPFGGPEEETPGVADGEDTTEDRLGANEPNFADQEPSTAASGEDAPSLGNEPHEAEIDEGDEDDDEDEDATLADEGASSFDPKADDDPLGDRLSGGDN